MCAVPIDSKWRLFRLDFYFVWLNASLSCKPVFMWQIQILHSTLHFKKKGIVMFMKSLLVAIIVICLWYTQHVIGSTLLMSD